MTSNTQQFIMKLLRLFLIGILLTGCGSEQQEGITLQDLPIYPDATEGESMQANMFGTVGGGLTQYSTSDDYDEVLAFYKESLSTHSPELMNHSSELGRQAVLSIAKNNGMVSVAIQEFTEENQVAITFMEVGN